MDCCTMHIIISSPKVTNRSPENSGFVTGLMACCTALMIGFDY
jgi:hypothetical protein